MHTVQCKTYIKNIYKHWYDTSTIVSILNTRSKQNEWSHVTPTKTQVKTLEFFGRYVAGYVEGS